MMVTLFMSEEQVNFLFELVDMYLKETGIQGLQRGVNIFNSLTENVERHKKEQIEKAQKDEEKTQEGTQIPIPPSE